MQKEKFSDIFNDYILFLSEMILNLICVPAIYLNIETYCFTKEDIFKRHRNRAEIDIEKAIKFLLINEDIVKVKNKYSYNLESKRVINIIENKKMDNFYEDHSTPDPYSY